ncbi:formylglycine-generating enzyme family protein [Planctomicrobium sp. SH668]|uniref:formylglycine-generating enzyme family protein n=1 Tax=Planctomicrobium sp. SH668 TaxID=3448126 RepID=UPI003F5CA3C6
MRCALLPAAEVCIGRTGSDVPADESPEHLVRLDCFLIDAEPVSTTAYCRFLNSIENPTALILNDWFLTEGDDDRQLQVHQSSDDQRWLPRPGTDRVPMVMVSWFGAAAYSLWVNGQDWRGYLEENAGRFLPSEAEWEYAARGSSSDQHCGAVATELTAACGRHMSGASYDATTMPLAAVNEELGMSPFGLHHMGGNVWQWCRDWYDEAFYKRPESLERNPVNTCNTCNTGIRSERGGSWVGPVELCSPTYRRGRAPSARGRCLGFRCLTDLAFLEKSPK